MPVDNLSPESPEITFIYTSKFINSNEKVLYQKVLTTNKTFHQVTILATPTQQILEKTMTIGSQSRLQLP